MEVTVYEPQEQKEKEELRRRMALAHARGVVTAIGELCCPEDQKIELLGRVKSICRDLDRACTREREEE